MIERDSEDHGATHRRWPFLAVWAASTVGLVLALFIARPPETRTPTRPAPHATALSDTAPAQSVVSDRLRAQTRFVIARRDGARAASAAHLQGVPVYLVGSDW